MGLIDRPDDKPVSDARALWEDLPKPASSPDPGHLRPSAAGDVESIDLAPVNSPTVRKSFSDMGETPRGSRARIVPDRSGRIESARDFPLWSRGKESGPHLFRVLMSAGCTLIIAWIFADWNTIHLSGWVAVIGSIVTILLAYPLVVGLERPVRSSPERAVRDFLESLEHHGPLYHRMWLLLTPEAQNTAHYSEFSGFSRYWKGRIQEWRHRGDAWAGTPVVMTIDSLNVTPDSVDPLVRHMKFDLAVSLRGRRNAGPVARYAMNWIAERGRDSQWYLRQADPPE